MCDPPRHISCARTLNTAVRFAMHHCIVPLREIVDGIRQRFAAYITAGEAQLEQGRGLMTPGSDAVLTALTY